MQIERVRAFPLQYPEPNNDGKLRSITVVASGAGGATGWGEAISGSPVVSQGVAFMAERRLAPMLIGQDPRDVARLWAEMRDATFWDGTGGIVTFALSALDMALWDLAGKLQGVPLYQLLGGRRRDRIRACASAIFASDDLDRVAQEFAGFVEQGYTAVKGGWGHDLSVAFGRDRQRDLAIARTVRDAVGPDVDMICDVVALAGWSPPHAIRMAPAACSTSVSTGSRTRWWSRTWRAIAASGPRSRSCASAPARRAGRRTTTGRSSTLRRSTS